MPDADTRAVAKQLVEDAITAHCEMYAIDESELAAWGMADLAVEALAAGGLLADGCAVGAEPNCTEQNTTTQHPVMFENVPGSMTRGSASQTPVRLYVSAGGSVAERHLRHAQQCSCLNDSAECCRPTCECHVTDGEAT